MFTEEQLVKFPPEAQAIIRAMAARIAELEALLKRGKTPQNSSLPPSTQHPHAKPVPKKRKSKEKAAIMTILESLSLRFEPVADDLRVVRELVAATGFFYPAEVNVAVELVDERLAQGIASGYHFVFAELAGQLLGYTCYGPIPCTATSFDLYWIAVRPAKQRGGIGRHLMQETERQIQLAGGARIYLDTSSRPLYESTRTFYERCGFRIEAWLKDFYARGDDKIIFVKECSATTTGACTR